MKLKEGILMQEIDGQYMVVDGGENGERFQGLIKMNGTAAFVTKQLMTKNVSLDDIVKAMVEKYDVTENKAKASAERVIDQLRTVHMLVETGDSD